MSFLGLPIYENAAKWKAFRRTLVGLAQKIWGWFCVCFASLSQIASSWRTPMQRNELLLIKTFAIMCNAAIVQLRSKTRTKNGTTRARLCICRTNLRWKAVRQKNVIWFCAVVYHCITGQSKASEFVCGKRNFRKDSFIVLLQVFSEGFGGYAKDCDKHPLYDFVKAQWLAIFVEFFLQCSQEIKQACGSQKAHWQEGSVCAVLLPGCAQWRSSGHGRSARFGVFWHRVFDRTTRLRAVLVGCRTSFCKNSFCFSTNTLHQLSMKSNCEKGHLLVAAAATFLNSLHFFVVVLISGGSGAIRFHAQRSIAAAHGQVDERKRRLR